MPIQVKEVAFIFQTVTDVSVARHFYEGFLGLKVGVEFEIAPGKWWIEYDIAGVALGISNAMPGQPSSSVVLEVADLDATYAATKSAAVPLVSEILDFPTCRMFQVKDPDGNEISLHQRKARA